ncbi:putative phage tail protein [uncultured Pseudacidovorax sp.]|uniref:YmfQ family protein n=1 Tax=uncultured Pseudacidovorax sp. TaxID=679313 RepID=UPI0025E0B1CD|nr:putative phage tail protein [uncultured Pseudacidovorax sp.]
MPAPLFTAAEYAGALQALLPRGRVWNRDPDSEQGRLALGLAGVLATNNARANNLLRDAFPASTLELLEEWEATLGLPDECMAGQDLTVADRQRIVLQRVLEQGGQSRPYFLALAASLGYPWATITEFAPMNCDSTCDAALYSEADRHVWRFNFNQPADSYRQMTCNDVCTSALTSYAPSLAECPISERTPAHTTVIFGYLTDDIFTLPDWRDWAYYLDLGIAALPEA